MLHGTKKIVHGYKCASVCNIFTSQQLLFRPEWANYQQIKDLYRMQQKNIGCR